MKKIILLLTVTTVAFQSCKKDPKENASKNSIASPGKLMNSFFAVDEEASDFTVVISTVHPNFIGPGDLAPVNRSNTAVQGFGKDSENLGDLYVNNYSIPFTDQKTYYKESEVANASTFSSSLTGTDCLFNFKSRSGFPSFTYNNYSPAISQLSFQGLNSDGLLSANSDITLSWTPDSKISGESNLLIVRGENSDGGSEGMYSISVQDADGRINIPASEIAKYSSFKYVGFYLARGYEDRVTVDKKTINYLFINYTWASIKVAK